MSTKPSPEIVLAWNWVVQALISFKNVKTSTLVGLVKKFPAVYYQLDVDARDRLSLRVLEDLFIHETDATNDNNFSENDKISFDLSDHCEDVLHRIINASDPMTKLEREKWNIRPFIMHKKSSLPKSSFEKFKEALLEGSHPFLLPLKARSKVGSTNELEPANENKTFQENIFQESNEVPEHIKREEHGMSIESSVKDLEENTLMDHVDHGQHQPLQDTSSKKVPEFGGESRVCKNDTPPNVSEKNGNQLETGGDLDKSDDEKSDRSETLIKSPVKDLEENTLMDHVDHGQHHPIQETCSKKVLEFGVESRVYKNDTPPNVSVKNGNQLKTDGDLDKSDDEKTNSDKSDDERTDILVKKKAFLSSQCTFSQDSMFMNENTEICVCMKCNQGGQLLTCNSNTCPIRVHESCIDSCSTFSENEGFFCPFCTYSRAISKYVLVKKKASLAIKDLRLFLSSGAKFRQKKSSKKGDSGEELVINDDRDKGVPKVEAPKAGTDCRIQSEFCEDDGSGEDDDDDIHSSEKESSASGVSSHPRRLCKRKPQQEPPPIPLLGRKKLQWTQPEVEMLKEGVKKFANVGSKRMPWSDILVFGREVFHKDRSAMDLKDKWRNIWKGSSLKKQKL